MRVDPLPVEANPGIAALFIIFQNQPAQAAEAHIGGVDDIAAAVPLVDDRIAINKQPQTVVAFNEEAIETVLKINLSAPAG